MRSRSSVRARSQMCASSPIPTPPPLTIVTSRTRLPPTGSTRRRSTRPPCCAGSTDPAPLCSSSGRRGGNSATAPKGRALWAATSVTYSTCIRRTRSSSRHPTGSTGRASVRRHAIQHQCHGSLFPALAERRLVGPERGRAHRDERLETEIGDHEHERLGGRQMWVEIVSHLPAALALGEEDDQPLDRGREGARLGPAGLG